MRRAGWTGEVFLAVTLAGLGLEVLAFLCTGLSVCVHSKGSGEGPGPSGLGFSFHSSLAASGPQVEYLYSLVYQALDFISGKK